MEFETHIIRSIRVYYDEAGRGRKKKTADHEDNTILQRFHENPLMPRRNIANYLNASKQTVTRRLKERSLTFRIPCLTVGHGLALIHRCLRLKWHWHDKDGANENREPYSFPTKASLIYPIMANG